MLVITTFRRKDKSIRSSGPASGTGNLVSNKTKAAGVSDNEEPCELLPSLYV